MFHHAQQRPDIEFNPDDGQTEPMLVHHFSNRGDPFKSLLPVLSDAGDEEQVLVVESPLSELVDWTIQLHAHPDFPSHAVVDHKHRGFFEAVRASLAQAIAKVDHIQYAQLDDEEDGDGA